MLIHEHDLNWYLNRLQDRQYYSFAGYSDAEWYCILKERVGEKTAAGQVISAAHGERLLDIVRRRHKDERFLFAVPKCLRELPAFVNGEIDLHRDTKAQFVGQPKDWEYDGDGVDAVIQVIMFGEIIYG